jgi:hypothetical protein
MRTQWLRARLLVHSGLACSVIALAGCGSLDPYQKEYVWRPTGAPQANIAAQLVNPQDLAVGRGSTVTNANASTLAIQRIWTDTPKSLTGGGGASGGSGGGSGNGSGSGPGASAGGQGGSSGGTGGSN